MKAKIGCWGSITVFEDADDFNLGVALYRPIRSLDDKEWVDNFGETMYEAAREHDAGAGWPKCGCSEHDWCCRTILIKHPDTEEYIVSSGWHIQGEKASYR